MGFEDFIPTDDKELIHALVPKDLVEFLDEIAMANACQRADVICNLIKYERKAEEIEKTKGDKIVSVRLPPDLADFIKETRKENGRCTESEAIRIQLAFARRIRDVAKWYKAFHAGGRIHPKV